MPFYHKPAEVDLAAAKAQQFRGNVRPSGTRLITPLKQRAGAASMAPVTPLKRALENASELSAPKRHKDGNTQNTPRRSASRLARKYLRPADQHYATSAPAFEEKYAINFAEFIRYKQSLGPDGELECSCGKRAVYYTVLSKWSENYGRDYRGCHIAFPKPGNCGLFFWEEDVADFEAYDEGPELQENNENDEIRSITVSAEDDGQSQV